MGQWVTRACIAVMLTWLPVTAAGGSLPDSVRITNGEWPPYLSEELPHHGIASRIVKEAFESQGISVEFSFYPWARSLSLAEDGTYDGTAVWTESEDRQANFFLSDPVVNSQYVFFHRRDQDFDWASWDDLSGYRIGATTDYFYSDAFEDKEAQEALHVERERSDIINLRKLQHGRIDIFPLDPIVGAEMLRSEFSTREKEIFTFHPRPLHTLPLRLMLNRRGEHNEALMEAFNQGLAEMREEGRIQQYMNEYRLERARLFMVPRPVIH